MLRYETIEAEDADMCKCTGKHVPRPTVLAVIRAGGQRIHLCPTSMMNLNQLLWEYDLTDGDPLGSITKHYGKYVRDLADKLYEGSEAGVRRS
jgi:hypothetical protein